MANMFSTFKSTDEKKYPVWNLLDYLDATITTLQFATFPVYKKPEESEARVRFMFTAINRNGEEVRKWSEWLKVTDPTYEKSALWKLFNGDTVVTNALLDEDYDQLMNVHFKVQCKPNKKNPKFSVVADVIANHEDKSAINFFYDLAKYPPYKTVRSFGLTRAVTEQWVRLEDGTAHCVEEEEFKPQDDSEQE